MVIILHNFYIYKGKIESLENDRRLCFFEKIELFL